MVKDKGLSTIVIILIVVIAGVSLGTTAYVLTRPQPEFQVKNLSLSQDKIAKGDTITAQVEVTNVGDAEGTHTVELEVEEETLKEKVTLEAGESKTVSFDITKQEKGTHTLTVEKLSKTFETVKPAEFELSNLQVSPEEAEPGETVTVTVDVKNTGGVEGSYELELEVDGAVEKTREVTLESGKETTETFTLTKESSKSYSVEIEDLSQGFEVLEPAKFETSNFRVSPEEPVAGEEFTASVDVKNVGELEGTYEAVWKVEGDVDDTHEVTLDPGETRTVTFSMVWNDPGTYSVSLSGVSRTLTVLKPAEFEVSNLRVSPSEVGSGESVEISAKVRNIGEAEGTYEPILKINGNKVDSKQVTLSQGESTTISFFETIKNVEPGTYVMSIGEEVVNLEILEPAKFEVSNLRINPSQVGSGETVEISLDVSNEGDLSGEYEVKLEINGTIEKTKSISLSSREETTVSFAISKGDPGSYSVGIGGLSKTFKVLAVPENSTLSGNITEDTILTTSLSPYTVEETLQVLEDVTLKIESGVTIKFKKDTALKVGGELIAVGNREKRINFRGPSSGYWGGVRFVNGAKDAHFDKENNYVNGSIIKFSKFVHGRIIDWGIINILSSSPFITNNIFQNTGGDETINVLESADVRITNNKLINNCNAFSLIRSQDVYIENNLIEDSTSGALNFYITSSSSVKITNNRLINNDDGLVVKESQNVRIGNNLIENNGNRGLFILRSSAIKITNNKIIKNKGDGLSAEDSRNLQIESNLIESNKSYGVSLRKMYRASRNFHIENNLIRNNRLRGVYIEASEVSIRKNEITSNGGTWKHGGGIYIDQGNNITVNKNNFWNNKPYALNYREDYNLGATQNYWGTTNKSEIENKIYDYYDDISLGKVIFEPIATEPFR